MVSTRSGGKRPASSQEGPSTARKAPRRSSRSNTMADIASAGQRYNANLRRAATMRRIASAGQRYRTNMAARRRPRAVATGRAAHANRPAAQQTPANRRRAHQQGATTGPCGRKRARGCTLRDRGRQANMRGRSVANGGAPVGEANSCPKNRKKRGCRYGY